MSFTHQMTITMTVEVPATDDESVDLADDAADVAAYLANPLSWGHDAVSITVTEVQSEAEALLTDDGDVLWQR